MRTLDITKDAFEVLRDLQVKPYRQVVQKVMSLMVNPEPNDASKLVGYEYWRADIGEYRIIYRFDAENVFVILVAKRNDDEVYKRLSRR